MQFLADTVWLSPSDLMQFAGCEYATALNLRKINGEELHVNDDTAAAELLQKKGDRHEEEYLKKLYESGLSVVEIDTEKLSEDDSINCTLEALSSGVEIIFQATFRKKPWRGYADFVRRVEKPSKLGTFSYEIIDTKLKRSPDPKHILQLCLYSEILGEIQGVMPEYAHLVLGNGEEVSFRLEEYFHYYRGLKLRMEAFIEQPCFTESKPVAACDLCRWQNHCKQEWADRDDLCRVANLGASQSEKLKKGGIDTLSKLADATTGVPGLHTEQFERMKIQASLQKDRYAGGPPEFRRITATDGKGWERLPAPAKGDLFFDIEGDPLFEGGLEYLFGIWCDELEGQSYKDFWAHDRPEEALALTALLKFFSDHLKEYPEARIYHYAHYEVGALKRLCSFHGVGEAYLDTLLRQERFVDLYGIVKNTIIISEPAYSIKNIEAFYMEQRTEEVTSGADSIVQYEQYLETKDEGILRDIRDYNEVDCRSTQLLRDWLIESARPDNIGWPTGDQDVSDLEEDPKTLEREAARDALASELLAQNCEPELIDLLLGVVDFHWRETKPVWWGIFERASKLSEELLEDNEALGMLRAVDDNKPVKQSTVRSYEFPYQLTKLTAGSYCSTWEGELNGATIDSLDLDECIVSLKRSAKRGFLPDCLDVIGSPPLNTGVIERAIGEFASSFASPDNKYQAAVKLLSRNLPDVSGVDQGQPLLRPNGDMVTETCSIASRMESSTLVIQGPPGTGKTYISSQAIVSLIKQGKRIAVSANSHKAINNLLHGVEECALNQGVQFFGIKKSASEETEFQGSFITNTGSNEGAPYTDHQLVAGTAWLLAREECWQSFDYLFIDEAGQVSLANFLALSLSAENIVLVGDQMQLTQPIQGVHPGDVSLSALEYYLEGAKTVPGEKGIFLSQTRRMHPNLTSYISSMFYEGRLKSHESSYENAIVSGDASLSGAGIRLVEIPHEGNSVRCEQEADRIVKTYKELLDCKFLDERGIQRNITKEDILVLSPYNIQVRYLEQVLPEGARVGTVDKFQGQEAPVCLISMTTSSAEEAPRGLEFLFSPNRLNVAISRAKALSIIFLSPDLYSAPCRSVRQMKLVNQISALPAYSK